MQLTPIAPVSAPAPVLSTAPTSTSAPARPLVPLDDAPNVAPAPASAPAAVAGAIDGVTRLETAPATTPPLVDFPGIEQGDEFAIVKGSKVGFLGVKGDARILKFTPTEATFHIKAGAFGVKVDVEVEVVQTGPETVRITSRGTGVPNMTAKGRVVETRTNYMEFERIGVPEERTIISHDGAGNVVIDTVIPTVGDAHLVLEKK